MVANGVDSKKIKNSKMLFMILDDSINGVKVIDKYGSSLDTFTTFLGYIGVTDEMNLGRNILIKDSIDNTTENINMLYKAAMGGLLSIKYKK
jgi:putative phosphoglycerol transferase I